MFILHKIKQFNKINYDVLFVGDDWKGDPLFVELENKLSQNGAQIKYFEYTKDVSSTKFTEILQKIFDEDMKLK